MKRYQKIINKVRNSEEFQKLATIGGHKIYHLEGNALIHTNLVVKAAERKWGKGHFMVLVALLHDIGKIYTSVCNGPDDWSYPHHSDSGAQNLSNFISEEMPEFKAIQWYIYNHIQPLFWQGKDIDAEVKKIMKRAPRRCGVYCRMDWLRDLALCDLEGSKSVEPQTKLVEFLKGLDLPHSFYYKVYYLIKYEGKGIWKVNNCEIEFHSAGEVMNYIDNGSEFDSSIDPIKDMVSNTTNIDPYV